MQFGDNYLLRKYSGYNIDEYRLFKKCDLYYTTEATKYRPDKININRNIKLKRYYIERVTEDDIYKLKGTDASYIKIDDLVLKITEYYVEFDKFKVSNKIYF